MARMGRPTVEIDKKQFENLCAMQCSEEEIAGFFDCDPDTINNWCKRNYTSESGKAMTFSEVFAQKRVPGKISLRRNQWNLSKANATMAIFLGKQYLGQQDVKQLDIRKTQEEATDETLALLEEIENEECGEETGSAPKDS